MTLRPSISSPASTRASVASQSDNSSDDFVMLHEVRELPLRPRQANRGNHVDVELHPLPSHDSFLVSVQTPKVPDRGLNRAFCDIVLVIDVSGSMTAAAPLPDVEDQNEREAAGLSILDLTKHAARTILETLNDGDRLGIVTFSDDAKIIQLLASMTPFEKAATLERIEKLRDESCTNLWSGIRTGLELFEQASLIGNVQGMYVLTDGMPNHMCPKQGYVAKLAPMLANAARKRACIPTIHTFGFGYSIKSDLMQSIAEVGRGNYAFIPDAGMIGTVFVHAVANLFTTLGTFATLELKTSRAVDMTAATGNGERGRKHLRVNLGNIQYGQSRDIIVRSPNILANTEITATLSYSSPDGTCQEYQAHGLFSEMLALAPEVADYHMYRGQICELLASLFPLKENGEHGTTSDKTVLAEARQRVEDLAISIRSSQTSHTPQVRALLQDLMGEEPAGQISKALLSSHPTNYWDKWGRHYLPSLLHAHQRQMCNTFKDPGPLCYGRDSPLFVQCRDELDTAFDNLPAPKPSRPPRVVNVVGPDGRMTKKTIARPMHMKMSRYNNCSSSCFQGSCEIKLANGSRVPVRSLKPGMLVWTPLGGRPVAAVLKTWVRGSNQKLCRIGDLLITPWHPVKHQGQWVFPNQIAQETVSFKGSVYSVLLAPSQSPDAHAIEVGGLTCVTLGHGVTGAGDDVRSHAFFGNYRLVRMSLSRLQTDSNGHLRAMALQRDRRTGLACGFAKPMGHCVMSRSRAMAVTVRVRLPA